MNDVSFDYWLREWESQSSRGGPLNDPIELATMTLPICRISGTSQEIVAPYLNLQLQSGAQGACFLHPGELDWEASATLLVGKDPLAILKEEGRNDLIRLALLDALFGARELDETPRPTQVLEISGTYSLKSMARAETVVASANLAPGMRVGLVGAVHDLARVIAESYDCELRIADLGQAGGQLLGIPIETSGVDLLGWSDAIIVTGNTLKTQSLAPFLEAGRARLTACTVFAMTGANIAPNYLRHGASAVVTERSPYYWQSGCASEIRVFQGNDSIS